MNKKPISSCCFITFITFMFAQASMAHTAFFATLFCVTVVGECIQPLCLCTGVARYVQGACVIGQVQSNSAESNAGGSCSREAFSPTQFAHLAGSLWVNHLTDMELPVCTQTQRRARARTVHLICQLQIELKYKIEKRGKKKHKTLTGRKLDYHQDFRPQDS